MRNKPLPGMMKHSPMKAKTKTFSTQEEAPKELSLEQKINTMVDEEVKKQEKILDQKYRLGGYKGGQKGRKI